MGVRINALTATTTPADTDVAPLDTSAGTRKVTWANIKATLKTYFDTLYTTMVYTAPASVTPTFTGFGSVSGINAYTWRVGAYLHYDYTWTAGTPTGVEAQVTLRYNDGSGEASVTTASTLPTLSISGNVITSSTTRSLYALAEASKTYMTFGIVDQGTYAGLVKRFGDVLIGGSQTLSARGSVRIQGW